MPRVPSPDEPLAGQRRPTPEERERVARVLGDHFANDVLELDEYEERVERAERVETAEELAALLADLEPAAPSVATPVPGTALAPSTSAASVPATTVVAGPAMATPATAVPATAALVPVAKGSRSVVAVFANVARQRDWTPAPRLKVLSVFGNSDLDFREARLVAGLTEVRVISVFGNARLIVPPEVRVEVDGTGIFGNFEGEPSRGGAEEARTLRVSGVAVFGNVEVEERLPGESSREARRRRKVERKQLRVAERTALPPGRKADRSPAERPRLEPPRNGEG